MTATERARVLRRHGFEPDGIAAILGVDVADVVAAHSDPSHVVPEASGLLALTGPITWGATEDVKLDRDGSGTLHLSSPTDYAEFAIEGDGSVVYAWTYGLVSVVSARTTAAQGADGTFVNAQNASGGWAGLGADGYLRLTASGKEARLDPDAGLQFGPVGALDVTLDRYVDANDDDTIFLRSAGHFAVDHGEGYAIDAYSFADGSGLWSRNPDWTRAVGFSENMYAGGEPALVMFSPTGEARLYPGELRLRDVTLKRAAAGVVENPASGGGLRLHSPDGTAFTLTVSNAGALVIA